MASDRQTHREAARWIRRYAQHSTAFHAVRLPRYAVLVVVYTVRGVGVLAWRVVESLADAEARPLRVSVVRCDDVETYLKLAGVRSQRVRWIVVAVVLVVVGQASGDAGPAPSATAWLVLIVILYLMVSSLGRGKRALLLGQRPMPLAHRLGVAGLPALRWPRQPTAPRDLARPPARQSGARRVVRSLELAPLAVVFASGELPGVWAGGSPLFGDEVVLDGYSPWRGSTHDWSAAAPDP